LPARGVSADGLPKPPGVDRNGELLGPEIRLLARDRPAAVAGDSQVGAELLGGSVVRAVADSLDASRFADQLRDLALHPQREGRLLPAGLCEQIEQVPLRHHRDVRIPHPQPAEIGNDHAAVDPDRKGDLVQPAVRELREPLSEAQLVEQLQGRRVHGVAAEVPQEVAVLLQDAHLDTGPG
jgi:hypothetical protein